jgi:LacI family transcriptional regulator
MARPTIQDVARRSGFSKATVSAVLNDSSSVKTSTRARILDVMDELNYRPRAAGRNGEKVGRSLAIVIKEIDNPYYAEVVAGARAAANKKGYTVQIGTSEGDPDAEKRLVDVFRSKDIDGLIIIPVISEQADLSYVFELNRRNIPYVLLEEVRGIQASVIDVDNIEASKSAVKYLIDLGHTEILHFAGPEYSMHSEERIEGVRRAYSESSLVFGDEVVVPAGAHLADGYRAGKAYFASRENRPTGITCYNDLVAIGLMRALEERGLRVPQDVSVIGYDDIEILEYLPTPLTSIRVPKREMGQKAAELLIQQIEAQKKVPPQKIHLQAELVVRKTTTPKAG